MLEVGSRLLRQLLPLLDVGVLSQEGVVKDHPERIDVGEVARLMSFFEVLGGAVDQA
jgi:hypothetical protein